MQVCNKKNCGDKVFFTPNAATAHISIRRDGGAAGWQESLPLEQHALLPHVVGFLLQF